jgi:hypothetical protein
VRSGVSTLLYFAIFSTNFTVVDRRGVRSGVSKIPDLTPLRSTTVKFVLKMAKYNKVEIPDLTPLRSTTVKFVWKMAKCNKVEIPDLTPLQSTTVKFVLKMAKYNKVEIQ